MSGEFITALDPTSFKTTTELSPLGLDKQSYTCTCGLRIGAGVDKLDPGAYLLRRPAVLKAAHQRHHDLHFGAPATLYLISGRTPTGIETLAAAQCSCDYDAAQVEAANAS